MDTILLDEPETPEPIDDLYTPSFKQFVQAIDSSGLFTELIYINTDLCYELRSQYDDKMDVIRNFKI